MGDQNIDFPFVLFYHSLSFLFGKAELPIEEFWSFADPKHCQAIDIYSFEVQEVANTLKLKPFLICLLSRVWISVVIGVEDDIVIARNDYLVAVWHLFDKGSEAGEFFWLGFQGEVASVDEEISLGKAVELDLVVHAVGVREGNDFPLPFRHSFITAQVYDG